MTMAVVPKVVMGDGGSVVVLVYHWKGEVKVRKGMGISRLRVWFLGYWVWI